MKKQDRIWKLFAKKLSGEASEKELAELELLLQKDPDATYSLQLLEGLWQQEKETNPQEAEGAFAWHLQRMARHEAQIKSANRLAKQSASKNNFTEKVKNLFYPLLSSNGMLQSYFKVTWRNLFRYKGFSFINISGLAIGMASAILILLWIQNEFSFDEFHTKKDRIYQLYSRATYDGRIASWPSTPMVMGSILKLTYPEIEEEARLNWVAAFILSAGEKHLQTQGYLTDPGFLKMFDFPLKEGNASTALDGKHSIVITEKLSKKFFGDEDAMGKVIKIDSNAYFTVTGVMKDLPNNTRFNFDYLVPWSYMKEIGWDNPSWGESSIVQTFVLLKPGVSEKIANERLRNVITAHATDIKTQVFVHPLSKLRLYGEFENGKNVGGFIQTIRLFGIIAGFILLIACINYMNLSTARSEKRAREVGIRKVVGAEKRSLVWRFLGESIIISALAGFLALVIVQPSLKWFNWLIGEQLTIPYGNIYFWLSGIGFVLFTGVIAGSYPAFYLSAFKPVSVLKGTFRAAHALITPRKVLVVFQFTFAIIFIICTIIVYRQIAYGRHRDTGYNQENLAFVYMKGNARKDYPLIKDELLKSGAVTDVTQTNSPITFIWSWYDGYEWKGKDPNNKTEFIQFGTDDDFIKTMGLKLADGRDINTKKFATDSNAVLLNESAVKLMGFKNPVGQQIVSKEATWHVVGVIKDFVLGGPFAPHMPLVAQGPNRKNWFGTITFRLNAHNATSDNLKKISDIFKKYTPDYPLEYYFVDESYAQEMEGEKHVGMIALLFTGLTILISCLGLFALSAYMAENRIKEIGVRKVLGASAMRITTLLSKDFLILIVISFVIASPIAWWCMNSWLQNYSYRVNISWWIFGLTGFISIFIAVATVSYQSIRAALANPVKSLRTE